MPDTALPVYREPLYRMLASSIDARKRCLAHPVDAPDAAHWRQCAESHEAAAEAMLYELPHGSGLDGDWAIDWARCNDNRIVLTIDFHNMNSNGYYCGWSTLTVTVKSSLLFGLEVRVVGAGRGNSDLADSLADSLCDAFETEHERKEFMLPFANKESTNES